VRSCRYAFVPITVETAGNTFALHNKRYILSTHQHFLIPATYHSYQTVYLFKQAHSQNVSLIDAVVQIIKAFKVNANVSPLFYIETIFWYGAGFISIIVLAAFAECLSQWYKNGRYQTYHAVTASVVVGIVVINMVCCPLNFLILYNYIEITK
jgi:hypothetical protein